MFLEGGPSIRPGSGIIGIAQTFSRWDGWKLICVSLEEETEENFLWMRKEELK